MEKKIEAFGLDADGKTAKKWQDPFWWSPFRRFRASNTRCPQEEPDLRCGMCGWKPRFLTVFNNMSVFMFCYVCLGIFKGMMHSYFGAVLPSIEKRFQFSSEVISTVKVMDDVSAILTALLIGHFGGGGHRPRWIAAGSVIVGMGFLLIALPELLFPPSNFSAVSDMLSTGKEYAESFCTSANLPVIKNATNLCSTSKPEDHMGAPIAFGVAFFLIGIGSTTAMVLGTPFVDDNVKYQNRSLYFAVSVCGHIFGPLAGNGLGALFNNIYFDFSKPDFKPTDPRWISAWYLGFIITGLGTTLFGLTIGCFPSAIPAKPKKPVHADEDKEKDKLKVDKIPDAPQAEKRKQVPVTLRDMPKNLKRLLSNPTYDIKLLSQLVNGFVLAGFMQFYQKFMKEQFHLSQTTINLVGGMPPIFCGFVGTIIGGFIVKHFKFRPTQVCYLMAASSLVGACCYFGAMGLGCDMRKIVGVDDVADPYNMTNEGFCSVTQKCDCSFTFNPICDRSTRTTFISPCAAGCKSSKRDPVDKSKYYYDCSCLGNKTVHNSAKWSNANGTTLNKQIVGGICPKTCPNFVIYVVLMSLAKLAMGVPMSGYMMLQFRIVEYDLKSLGNAFSMVLMSIFGFLPAPLIMGRLIDSTCRLWQKSSCGTRGACWIYNADAFRWKLHVAVAIARVITIFIDLAIAYRVRRMTFDREKDEKDKNEVHSMAASTIGLVAMDTQAGTEMADIGPNYNFSGDVGPNDDDEPDQRAK